MSLRNSTDARSGRNIAAAVRKALHAGNFATASICVMALAVPMSASAQEDELEQVVVTARRQALENAADRKKASESIVDSIVADDAGMLPDNSVTEVLQRVAGVAIVRFGSLGDPDHFSAEGSGVQVRGLSGVAGRLNGREIFSASGGRGLSWSDVTPELMAAVDVYKSSTADLIEGGTGGQIDLRTKMPFDFSEPALQITASADYGDLAEEAEPGGSALLTDRWSTRFGDMGVLVDIAYNKYSQNSDFFRMEPFYRTRVGNRDVYLPGGYDYGDQEYQRTRKGLYAGFQWAPTQDLTISQTVFYSEYDDEQFGTGLFVTSKDLAIDPAGNNRFDENGVLISSDSLFLRDNATFQPSSNRLTAGGNTGISRGTSETRDISTSFAWTPSDRWEFNGAVQFVDSSSTRDNYDVFPGVPFPGRFGIDLSGSLPQIIVPDSAAVAQADPSQYTWDATMDHMERNDGDLRAGNFDVEYTLSEEGFFRSVQGGVRYAERTERDNNSGYNWAALGRGWNGELNPQTTFANSRPGDIETRVFDNFFRGETRLPGNPMMPSRGMVSRYDVVGDHAQVPSRLVPDPNNPGQMMRVFDFNADGSTPSGYGNPVEPIAFGEFDLTTSETTNTAAYGLLRFAGERGLFGLPYKGNVGMRYVRIENQSSGFFQQNGAQFLRNGVPTEIAEVGQPRSEGRTYDRFLPSINFQLLPTDALVMRLSYNVTLDQPSFQALRAAGTASVRTTGPTGAPVFDGFTTDTGNPRLLPIISKNSDFSLEWYASPSTVAHVALFHKSLDNWIVYGAANQPVPITYATGETVVEFAQSSNYFNSDKKATIKGVEIGGRTFFDRLPAPFDGLGAEVNYTYIDSKNPGDRYFDIDGVERDDVPVQGLSKNNYNIAAMYERRWLSLRLAYSWRSEYLMSTNANGTSGDYMYFSAPGVSSFTDISLPVYSDDYGSLDFGSTFRPNDHLSFSIELSNLTDEVAKTLQGGYPNGKKYMRSWFISDRRANVSVRYNF